MEDVNGERTTPGALFEPRAARLRPRYEKRLCFMVSVLGTKLLFDRFFISYIRHFTALSI